MASLLALLACLVIALAILLLVASAYYRVKLRLEDQVRALWAMVEERDQAIEELRSVRAGGGAKLDINTVTASQLSIVPDVGLVLVARILAARPFSSIEEVADVPRMPETAMRFIRQRFTVVPAAPAYTSERHVRRVRVRDEENVGE